MILSATKIDFFNPDFFVLYKNRVIARRQSKIRHNRARFMDGATM